MFISRTIKLTALPGARNQHKHTSSMPNETMLETPEAPAVDRAAPCSAFCEDCGGTGICGDEGPGRKNARLEWLPCDCPLGEPYRSYRELTPDAAAKLRARITQLEDALNEIYHRSDSTTHQMEIIEAVVPQKGSAQ